MNPFTSAITQVAMELAAAGVPTPRDDAELLVAQAVGLRSFALESDGLEHALDPAAVDRLRSLVARRLAREPLPYILGEWPFRGLVLKVDGRVLIPRPETETVVERCLYHVRRVRGVQRPTVVDVGVGSGAIALAVAREHSAARVIGLDISPGALSVARANVDRCGGRVHLVRADLLSGVSGPVDLVVSNPPYVAREDFGALPPELRLYEPYEAIIGADVSERLARQARTVLRPGGWLILECGVGQGARIAAALRAHGYTHVMATTDPTGQTRVVEGCIDTGGDS